MVIEKGYDSQLTPQAGAPMPRARPETYGAGLGEAAAQLGGTLHEAQIRKYQAERKVKADQELSDAHHKRALHLQSMDEAVRQLRANPTSPDYADHVERLRELNQAGREAVLGGVTEDAVRRNLEMQLDQDELALGQREGDYVDGQRVAKTLFDADQTSTLLANRIKPGTDPTRFAEAVKDWDGYTDGLVNLDPLQREKVRMVGHQKAGVAFGNSLIATNPKLAASMVETGFFDELLSPEQKERLRDGARIEIHSQEVAARTAAAGQDKLVRAQVGTSLELARAGQLQDPATLEQIERQAAATGDQALLLNAKEARAINGVAQVYRTASPQVIAADLATAEAALAAAGDHADPALTYTRNALAARLTVRREQASNDPAGEAGRLGMKVEAIDWAAPPPDAVQRRVAVAEAVAESTGNPPTFFMPDEVAALQADKSVTGRLDALRAAARFGGVRKYAAAAQLAPNDQQFVWLANLSEPVQRLALQGREELKNPQRTVFDDKVKAARVEADTALRRSLETMSANQRQGIYGVADAIEAELVAKGDPPGSAVRWAAIQLALGGSMRGGNVWQGGLGQWGEHHFRLPEKMTAGEFGTMAAAQANKNGPVDRDGKPVPIWTARPVPRSGTSFDFMGPDGEKLRRKDGSVFIVETAR